MEGVTMRTVGNTASSGITTVEACASRGRALRCGDPSIPATLDHLVASAVAMDPLDRPATARELAEEVEAFLDHELQVAREREAADQHARAAQRAADEATQDGRGTARAEALREAARALAFEPGNETAGKILAAMLVRPPSIPPPDAKRQLDEVERAGARDALRALGMRAARTTAPKSATEAPSRCSTGPAIAWSRSPWALARSWCPLGSSCSACCRSRLT
jgi:hypothetical protein